MAEFLSSIVELFRKYGIKSVTMDDIARELGISKKTLYKIVSDKNDLVSKAIEFEYQAKAESMTNMVNSGINAIDELFEFCRFISHHVKSHSHAFDYDLRKYYPEVFHKLSERKRDLLYNFFINNIERGKRERIYRIEMDGDIIAKLNMWRMDSLKDNSVFSVDDFFSGKIFRELVIYHIRGIANEQVIEFLISNKDKLNKLEFE
jgi:AcrR family transcriptional regulator